MTNRFKTPCPNPDNAYRWAKWDEEMTAMEERYAHYADRAEISEESGSSYPPRTPRNYNYDAALSDLGALIEAGDSDEDLTAFDAEMNDVETLRSLRETTYVRHVKNRSGEIIDEDAFRRGYEAREQLRDDTLDMAFKLHSVGRKAFADKNNPVAMLVCPESGRFHVLPNVVGRRIFPTVAAQKRAPMIAALELLLRRKEHRHDQFVTFTTGQRCTVFELRERFKALHRAVSKLGSQDFMKHAGASFIWRSSEVGSLTDDAGNLIRNELGLVTFHPHAHVLMHLERWLPRPQMRRLTNQINKFWGGNWWQIDGKIEKIREACKYVGKPAELRKLDAFELADLDKALFQLHLVQPLGELREQIKARREACLTIKRERRVILADGQKSSAVVPVVLPDWNARKMRRDKDPAAEERAKRRERRKKAVEKCLKSWPTQTIDGREYEAGELPIYENIGPAGPQAKCLRKKPVIRNRVVARLSPAPYFDRILRPALLVWNFDPAGLSDIQELPFVKPALEAVRARIQQAERDAASGAKVSVHTSPVTVRESAEDEPHPPPKVPRRLVFTP